jgi:hypothetical protein
MVTTMPTLMQAEEYNYRGACHSNTTNINITFCKKWDNPSKYQFHRRSREDGSVLHITNALISRISPPILVILQDAAFILVHIIEDQWLNVLLHIIPFS